MASGDPARGVVPVATVDGWLRCAHQDTAIDLERQEVTLSWKPAPATVDWTVTGPEIELAGLAFDPAGCLYHGDLDRSQVTRVAVPPSTGAPVDLLASPARPASGGDFAATEPPVLWGPRPVALAVDADQHLFLLDGASGAIHVLDLVDRRLVRTITLPWRPVDLALDGDQLLVATADPMHPLFEVARSGYQREVLIALPARDGIPAAARALRVAVGPGGERWIAMRAGASTWAVPVADTRRAEPLAIDHATDLELDGDAALVVAGPPGAELHRFVFSAHGDAEDAPRRARGYDGRGLVRTPEGRIGFWSSSGFRLALEARLRFVATGHVDTFLLDGQAPAQRWGRVFVEACVPRGTRLQVGFATADDLPDPAEVDGPSIPRALPANLLPDAQPLPPALPPLVATGRVPVVAKGWDLHRRETGADRPWVVPEPGDRFEVYEVPVIAPPGRYLWLRLMLTGTTHLTPRVRAVRAEYPGHDLLRRLPRAYSGEPVSADFLHRYLAITAGMLADIDDRAARRDLLFDPWGAPDEALPWIASLVGLTLDSRWSDRARRTMLSEAICLFRGRGTVSSLRRMLEIYLECDVVLVEAFRFRGTGGAFAGDEPSSHAAPAVVGGGFRVGGAMGMPDAAAGVADIARGDGGRDAFATHAHRFTVIVPRDLDDEARATVMHLLDLHRPAHTLVEVCSAGRGMRVGVGLHVALSTVVGPSSGFSPSVVGRSRVGTGTILGRPRAGVRPGTSHVGRDTLVDP